MLAPVAVMPNCHKQGNLKQKELSSAIMKYSFMEDLDISIISQLQVDINISWLVTLYSFEYNGDITSFLCLLVYSSSFNLILYLKFILISTNGIMS